MIDARREHGPSEPDDGPVVVQPGARLGGLRLVKELGIGGQGVVYRAVREADGLEVAAKILRTDISLSDDQIDRFEREAEAAGRLHHENIVAVHGIEEVGDLRIILQELVLGGDLDDLIKARHAARGDTTLDDCRWAAELCRKLALALAHAHGLKVVHRDMKPGNVLMTADGVPKITDFGLAKVEDMFGLTQTGDRMGTPNYMSPEQVEAARGGVDSRTDIYSLGAMLYRMVTRKVPFEADNLSTLFRDIMTRAPIPPRKLEKTVPKDLQAVILKTLQKSPADRYQTAEELAEDLGRFVEGKPTVARPEGFVVHTMRSMSHLSVSTLWVAAALVPTAWFAIDLLVRQGTGGNPGLHDVRYGLIAVCALALSWPLAILGLRMTRGRAWTLAASAAFALALAVGAGAWVREQKTGQLHDADREVLAAAIDFEQRGDRRDVDDLLAYVARWGDRLDEQDRQILGRGYVKRQRAAQAEEWVRRLETTGAEAPASLALALAVADALGDDARADDAAARLWALEERRADVGWTAWKQAGDVLHDVERHDDAMRAYRAAGAQPDAELGRDQLNLQLAQAEIGRCNWDAADKRLWTYIEWKPQDPAANRAGFKIASRKQTLLPQDVRDWSESEGYVAALERAGPDAYQAYLDARYTLLELRGDPEGAWASVQQVAQAPDIDVSLLDWCATRAVYTQRFADARDYWERMVALRPDLAMGHIGLTNAYYQLARRAETEEEQLALFRRSVAAGQRAMELDPLYSQTYWNTFLPMWRTKRMEKGSEEALDLADWQALLALAEQSLRYNSLQPETLNAASYAHLRLFERDADPAHLAEAKQYIGRAIRLTERIEQGACRYGESDRNNLSDYYDTLRDVEERGEDLPAALDAARTALAVLHETDADVAKRQEQVERLLALLAEPGR